MRLDIQPPELQKARSSPALRKTSLSSNPSEWHPDIPLQATLLEVEVLQRRLLRQPRRLQQSLTLASFPPIDFYLAQPQHVLIATPSFGRGLPRCNGAWRITNVGGFKRHCISFNAALIDVLMEPQPLFPTTGHSSPAASGRSRYSGCTGAIC
jgi:hypothetical protein